MDYINDEFYFNYQSTLFLAKECVSSFKLDTIFKTVLIEMIKNTDV